MSFLNFVLSALLVLFIATEACQSEELHGQRSSVPEATLKELSQSPQWLALLHYESIATRISPRSRAAYSDFFLSENGISDPLEELSATLQAMNLPAEAVDTHAICRFPARFNWLRTVGAIHAEHHSLPECTRFRQWYDAISPKGVTLVFPASFVNNPASAFGHTFLRLDHGAPAEDTRLLDYAADFAASTRGENALIYAIKGIFGGFDGFYSVAPFFKKVEKYSDLENRDIWEYQLDLSSEETSMLVSHLWELREHPFSYFYFDENCSYHILALLDVARPSLELVKSMRMWVIPVDTIRELNARTGLIKGVVFRPSAATKLRTRLAEASPAVQDVALKVADRSLTLAPGLDKLDSSASRAQALDLGYEYLTYQRIRNRSESTEEKQRSWEILAARSALPSGQAMTVAQPAVKPEMGHKTALFSIGSGRSEDLAISEFIFRPAFHSLIDPQGGYLPGNQIKFLETAARYSEGRGLELNRLTALDIMALTPRDHFFQPISWHVNLAYQQFQRENQDPLGLGGLTAGGGHSYQLSDSLLTYALLDGVLEYSSALNREHALGVGPKAGVIFTPVERYAAELSFSHYSFISGDNHQEQRGSISQRVTIINNLTLRFDVDYTSAFQNSYWSSMVRLERFFTP